jgi:ABC-type antimicrobial peptide transport system permease subunit
MKPLRRLLPGAGRRAARQRYDQRLREEIEQHLALQTAENLRAISFSVSRRTREIGVRMALGATPRSIRRLVIGESAKLVLFGLGAGIPAALLLARFLSALLFGVSPSDPLTFIGVALLLMLVALAAAYLPARRAMRVDPMVALRCE